MSNSTEQDNAIITPEAAKALLAPGEDAIHTFLNSSGMLIGADWSRESVIALLDSSPQIKLTGPLASSMGHGIAAWRGTPEHGEYVYIATKKED